MTQIQPNNQLYYQVAGPMVNAAPSNVVPNQQMVSVSQPNNTNQIYQYPQASVYNDPNKKAASGVNIYIYNPSGIGAPNSSSTANATYMMPQQPQPMALPANQVQYAAPVIANTPINNVNETAQKPTKTKRIVELTDDYIKTLENWLHSPDEKIRNSAIKEVLNRFEEDNTRYNDPALTALLNIGLQDPSASNRLLASSIIAGGSAQGDQNTVALLQELTKSDKMFGQEATMANNALLKAVQTTKIVPDYSPDKPSKK